MLKEFPDLEIRIESHTDSRGSDDYNMLLSKKRARAAFDYIVSKGIDPKRLLYHGYGETRLLNNCTNGVDCTEEQHEVNRRSIVKVVRKGEYKEKRGQKNIFLLLRSGEKCVRLRLLMLFSEFHWAFSLFYP